jgi:hypothetical protein
MDPTVAMPILVEATKFLFDQAGQWLDDARGKASPSAQPAIDERPAADLPTLSRPEFMELLDSQGLQAVIDTRASETYVYVIRGLHEQLAIHHRNLTDLEKTASEFGALTPTSVRRGIENEANAIVEKTARLEHLLTLVYRHRLTGV